MRVLPEGLYGKMLYNRTAMCMLTEYAISIDDVLLEEFENFVNVTVQGFAFYFDLAYEQMKTIEFLCLADFLTYVPCGSIGIRYMYETYGNSFIEARINKLASIMGKDYDNLSDMDKNLIREYFYMYDQDECDITDAREVANFISHVYNTGYSAYRDFGFDEAQEIIFKVIQFKCALELEDIQTEKENCVSALITEKEFDVPRPLNEEEIEYITSIWKI